MLFRTIRSAMRSERVPDCVLSLVGYVRYRAKQCPTGCVRTLFTTALQLQSSLCDLDMIGAELALQG